MRSIRPLAPKLYFERTNIPSAFPIVATLSHLDSAGGGVSYLEAH
jgi:hypothetical protein